MTFKAPATGFANSHGHYAYDGSREDGWVETDAGSFEDDVDSGFYQSNESFSGGGTFDTDGNSNSQYSAGGITTTTNGSYDSHELWSDDSTSVYKELYLDGETLLSESVSTGTADDSTTGHSTGHSTYTTLSSSSSTDTTSDSTYTLHWQWNETSRSGPDGTSNTADNSTTELRSSTYSMTYSCDGRWSTSGGTMTYSNSTPTVWTHSMGTPPTGTPTTPSYNGPTSSRWDDLIDSLFAQAAIAYNTPAARATAVDAALAAFADVDEDANGQNGGILLEEFSDPENNTSGGTAELPRCMACHGNTGRPWEQWSRKDQIAAMQATGASDVHKDRLIATVEVVGTVGASCVPYVGETMDAAVIADPKSSWWEVGLATLSLGLSCITAGVAPNFGAVALAGKKALGAVDKVADVGKVGRAAEGGIGGMRAAATRKLAELGLGGVDLAGKSYNAGRKALEEAGFVLDRVTSTGRKVFRNSKTGAEVCYDAGEALAHGQKSHWHIMDKSGQKYGRSGRAVGSDEGAGHIPGG